MPVVHSAPPQRSHAKLIKGLAHFGALKTKHERWTRLQPSSVTTGQILYAHPVYTIRLNDWVSGRPPSAATKRVAWMYFLRDSAHIIASAEVSLVAGAHKHARMSEGRFVNRTLRLIETVIKDRRVQRRRFQLRSIRVDALHFFAVWLKGRNEEFFIPVTPLKSHLRTGVWYSSQQLVGALLPEARRVLQAHQRVFKLSPKD